MVTLLISFGCVRKVACILLSGLSEWSVRPDRKAVSASSIETVTRRDDDFDDFEMPDLTVDTLHIIMQCRLLCSSKFQLLNASY